MESVAAIQFGLAPALATALLQALWQNATIGLGAWAALAVMARSGAALRHAVAMGFLLLMLLVPASTFAHFWQLPATAVNGGWLTAMTAPHPDGTGMFVQQSSPVAIVLVLLWLVGTGVMLLRHLGGWWMVSALQKHPFERLPTTWQRRVDRLRATLRIGRVVTVRLSASVAGPFTARLFRPVIWLPLSLITQLPRDQVEALLAHELAHVARMDWLWNGLQCLIESLLFFHPAVWWLSRRIRIEREHACDDLAVTACGNAIALAEALAQLERRRHPTPRLVLAAQGGSLMQRITRLISNPPSRSHWGSRVCIALVLAAGTLLSVQVAMAVSGQPGLRIRSTTAGVLQPGDMREIAAHGIDGDRYYRADVDASGRLAEVYKWDGKPQPIDAGVRRWLAEVTRLSVLPVQPEPLRITDTAAFQTLLRGVAAAPAVVDRVGTPVTMASNNVLGRIDIGNGAAPSGSANVSFEVTGPKGRKTVHVDAQLDKGIWSLNRVDVAGLAR
jgi:beta-lactamase regulating signal transducer with metallopeptidase domain